MKIGRRRRNIILSVVLCVILAVWTVWGNTALMVNTVAISNSRIPAAFSGFRIAQVSDLHNAEFGKNNVELLKLLSESRPDIIVITGDLSTYRYAVELFAHLCQQFHLDPLADGVVISHSEGCRRGIASNHGDVEHLWSKFGLSMGQFRKDIKAAMEESTAEDALTAIMGKCKATAGQMASYLKKKNPSVAQSVLDMIPLYLSEGEAEGLRGDIAFAQSCLETGNFTFSGSAVTLEQNNFCGLGVTQRGKTGLSFESPQLGIRAQVQHLKAYASTDALVNEKIDPRFRYVTRGCAPYVEWLGQKENPQGKGWAAGAGYGEKILSILKAVMEEGQVQFMESLTLSAPYMVRVAIPDLNIRRGPGTGYAKTGKFTGIGVFTIVEESDGWGLQQDGRRYSTVKTVRGVLRPAFQMAVDDDVLLKNPFGFELAGVVVNDSVTREAITKDQMRKFLKFVHDDNVYYKYYEVVYILFHTGMRISEFCGLTLRDIDLENKVINIDHQLQRTSDMRLVIESTKTNAGTRKLPMTDDVAQCFRAIIEDREAPEFERVVDGYAGFLFTDKNVYPEVAMHWEHRFNHMVKRYNDIYRIQMPNITPHVCRHTYCSNMAKSGMNPKTLQYLMGHSDIGVTLNTYTHLGLEDATDELRRMEDLENARKELEKNKEEKPVSQKMFRAI